MSATQLLVYGFGPGVQYEGRLVGALERIEGSGTLRIRDVLFVAKDPESGEVEAISLKGSSAGGLVAPLVGFRLDVAERRRATRRAMAGNRPGVLHPTRCARSGRRWSPAPRSRRCSSTMCGRRRSTTR